MDKFESLALWMALEISKNSDGDYAKLETRIAWSVWQSRQSEFDAMTEALLNQTQLLAKKQAEVDELQEEYADTELYLRGQLTDRDSKIANLEYLLEQDKSLIPILNKKLEEKDKRIEVALERLGLAIEAEKDWAIIEAVKILRGEHEA